jgi:hypothetical protein
VAYDNENPRDWNSDEETPQENINGVKFFENGFAEDGEHRIRTCADEHPYDTKFFRRHE